MIKLNKQDDTYAFLIINEEQVGRLEKHKRHGCYKLVMFNDSVKEWIPFKEYNKEKFNALVMSIYRNKRYEIYSEVKLENRGFTIKA